MGTLAGKVALVTGAGQGVGRGIAIALARQGARIVAAGRTLDKVERTAAEIAAEGHEARAVRCDVKDAADIEACVAATIAAFGTVDILVNNAQEVTLGPLVALDRAGLDAGWQSGPLAAFSFMQHCYPHLKGGGVVINLATAAGTRPDPIGYGAYAMVKEAMRSMSRAAACEWGPDNIRVISLMPLANSDGYLGWEAARPEEAAAFCATVPLQRVGDCVDDIGVVTAWLCSDEARYLTGVSIPVDGGQAYIR